MLNTKLFFSDMRPRFLLLLSLFIATGVAASAEPQSQRQFSSPFGKLMLTPVADPSHFPNEIENVFLRDFKLERDLQQRVSNLLIPIAVCLENDKTSEAFAFKKQIDQIVSELPAIKVFSPNPNYLNTTSQGRFGASNFPDKKIIINSDYPVSSNKEITDVFYLHESLEALEFKDRWYNLTGMLWTAYKNCNGEKETKNVKLFPPQLRKDLILNKNKSFSRFNIIGTPQVKIPNNSEYYANGGVTGIGSGGDPIVAFYKAELVRFAYKNEMNSDNKSMGWQISQMRIEGVPGIRILRGHANTEDYINNLNANYYDLYHNQAKALDLLDNDSTFMGILADNSQMMYIDTQIMHWFFNSSLQSTSQKDSMLEGVIEKIYQAD
ncbi:MAG: hypothetical protein ACXVCP_02275 [Bdellovibrio sp.]